MTRTINETRITELDMMMIRAGGRPQSEFEAMAQAGFGFNLRCRVCAALADALYAIVLRLETAARRSAETSHRRLAAGA